MLLIEEERVQSTTCLKGGEKVLIETDRRLYILDVETATFKPVTMEEK